jgi:hypothetical protein
MRVKQPDKDDWKKLCKVLNYLHSTIELVLSLSCESLNKLVWYIDGSYAVHCDMKGQSGAILMMDGCTFLMKSSKQKVNMRSSTESELIAIDYALPTVQWTKHFMREQGYDLETVLQEDNRSTMLLMKIGNFQQANV